MTDLAAGSGPPARRADARRNRRLILHAARDTFAEQGALASIEQIAVRAGLGKGTLYRHFSTREELVESVAEQFYLEAQRVCDEALAQDDAWEGLRMTLLGIADSGRIYENVLRASHAVGPSASLKAMSQALLVKLDAITARAVIAGVAREGLTGHDLGLMSRMLSGVQGLAGEQGLVHQPITPRERRRISDIVLSGLLPRGSRGAL